LFLTLFNEIGVFNEADILESSSILISDKAYKTEGLAERGV
jgi:hypothetical protein